MKKIKKALKRLDDFFFYSPGREKSRLDKKVFSFLRGGPEKKSMKKGKNFLSSFLNRVDHWFFNLLDKIDTRFLYRGRKVRTKSGVRVRSRAERSIAEMFDDLELAYHYEKPLVLDGIRIKPDFYLPKENIYVEFWGLTHLPGYNRIKERKQNLYKKHGIRVISLYPRDLGNLKANFLRLYKKFQS
ncbi:MAG: hypothetical protein Q8N58_02485 [bacterium]|nr:hypothetical protein [bacterium]